MKCPQQLFKKQLLVLLTTLFSCCAFAQTATENYVRSCTYKVATKTDIATPTSTQAMVNINYADGLGRPVQNIAVKQSPLGADMVQFTQYDAFGKVVKDFLPYTKTANNGAFITNTPAEQATFYTTANAVARTAYPYSEKVYDNSPLNRVLEQSAPGEVWQIGQGHTTQAALLVNEINEVKWYAVQTDGSLIQISNNGGFYPKGQLLGNHTTDENGNTIKTYQDGLGRIIMVQSGTTGIKTALKFIQTFYVYNDMGQLCYVLQPEWQEHINDGLTTAEMINRYAFAYQYDNRGFITYKKIPGAEPVYYVYDPMGKPILSQDGNQRALNKWMFTKYDALGRPILTGLWTATVTATPAGTHPNPVTERISSSYFTPSYFANFTNFYEMRSNTAPYYTNTAFPNIASSAEVLTKSYYDYIDVQGVNTIAPITTAAADYITNREATGYGNAVNFSTNKFSQRVRGQLIKTEAKELGSADVYNTNQLVYDKRYRIIQTNDSWEGVHNFGYDFEGKLTASLEKCQNKKIGKQYAYDLANRPKYNNIYYGTGIFDFKKYVYNNYNEIGQLIEKGLGNTTINSTGLGFLQSMDYRYNTRGWLTSINNAKLNNDNALVNATGTMNTWPYLTNANYASTRLATLNTIKAQVTAGTLSPSGALNGILAELMSQTTTSPQNYVAKYVVAAFDNISSPDYDYATTWQQLYDAFVAWQQGIYLNDDNTDLFGMELQYEQINPQLTSTEQYNGNISMIKWRNKSTANGGNATAEKGYGFTYDRLGRLQSAIYAEQGVNGSNLPAWSANNNRYNEENINYDRNGNIKTLTHMGMIGGTTQAPTFGTMDALTYSYIGNQLTQVADAQTATAHTLQFVPASNPLTNYLYDANGNMTTDPHKGITIQYNYLNLPQTILFANGNTIAISYDASGKKIKKTVTQNGVTTTKEYRGSFEFSGATLEAYYHEEGRLTPKTGGTYQLEYTLKDHLGNTRLTFADVNGNGSLQANNEILQENTYYPFGLEQSGLMAGSTGVGNKYQYNGIEFTPDLNLNLNMAFFRTLDPALGRWWQNDPVIKHNESSYASNGNNPIRYNDPMGDDFGINLTYDDKGNISCINFSATVFIQGEGASVARAKKLTDEAKATYQTREIDGVNISFDVKYEYNLEKKKENLDAKKGENLLVFKSEGEIKDDQSSILNLETRDNKIYPGNYGQIKNSGKNTNVILHETSHLLGFSDRYDGTDFGNPIPFEGFEDDLLGTLDSRNLSIVHYFNILDYTKSQIRKINRANIQTIYNNYNFDIIDIDKAYGNTFREKATESQLIENNEN